MTKIKNFRIPLRTRDVLRRLKMGSRSAAAPEAELAVDAAIKEARELIHPAAIYTTLTRATAEKATALEFPAKSVAASIMVVTIGPQLDEKRTEAGGDDDRARLLQALGEEAVQQSLQFAVRLLQEQAKEEECELSAPVFADDLASWTALTALLGSQRIGVSIQATEPAAPSYGRLAWVYWTPAARRSSKRSVPATRTAKIAA